MSGHGLLIWPSGPSTPPDAPPGWDERDEVLTIICRTCDSEFLAGQSCECSAPPAIDPDPAIARAKARHEAATRRHPDCEECRIGKGYIVPGPAHSSVHRGHCSCSGCF